MILLNPNGCPMSDYTNIKPLTMATSSITPEEEIKHCERAIKKYTETFMFTNWWSIFKIRRTQRMIRGYKKRIKEKRWTYGK